MLTTKKLWWLLVPVVAACGGGAPADGDSAANAEISGLKSSGKKKPICTVDSDPALCGGSGSHQPLPIENAYVDPASATFSDATLYFSTPAGPRLVHVVVGQGGDPPGSYVAGAYVFETDVPASTTVDQTVHLANLAGSCTPYWFGLYIDGALQSSGTFKTSCARCPEEIAGCSSNCAAGLTRNAGRNVCVPCGAPGALVCEPSGTCQAGLSRVGERCMRPTAKKAPELVIMCRYDDGPDLSAEARTRALFELSGSGTDGMFDFYAEMSYGALDLSGSKVIGWYSLGSRFDPAVDPSLVDRGTLINACTAAAKAKDPAFDYASYFRTLTVINIDLADDGNKWGTAVNVARDHLDTSFVAQEMGHAYGLLHAQDEALSPCGGAPGDYCDPWDVMSSQNNFGHEVAGFRDRGGMAGANGFIAGTRLLLGQSLGIEIIPAAEIIAAPAGTTTFTIAAINRPDVAGSRVVKIPIDDGHFYTVELVRKSGWDIGVPASRVLVHRVGDGRTRILPSATGDDGWPAGTTCSRTGLAVTVTSIDEKASTAVVTITR